MHQWNTCPTIHNDCFVTHNNPWTGFISTCRNCHHFVKLVMLIPSYFRCCTFSFDLRNIFALCYETHKNSVLYLRI
jgi:hypothetical protein